MPYPNYLCVFRANPLVQDDVLDCGLDPDFRPPIPTWGICRPSTRRSVVPGSYVVFLGYYAKDQSYLIKGWMRVGEKISYLGALERFGYQPNVIVRELTSHEARQPKSFAEVRWKRKPLQHETLRRNGTDSPQFLTTIVLKDRVYVQFDEDDHEIDNWKCQRMFLCQETQLKRCIKSGACLREPEFPHLTGYVVAAEGEWQDVGRLRLDWRAVAPPGLRDRSLRTPRSQHNALRLSDTEVIELVSVLSELEKR